MRRARRRSQRLINHNCFNSINDVFRECSGRVNQVSVFVGVFLIVMAGPAMGRNSRARVFRAALPCLALIALSGNRSAGANRHAGPVQLDAHQPDRRRRICRCAGPRRRRTIRSIVRSCRTRQGQARAVADRADPEIRPAGRERRSRFRATTCSTASARSRNTIRGRPSRSRRSVPAVHRRRLRRTRGCGFRFRRRQSAQQDADPARDGRHGGRTAAAQAPQDRRRSVRRGRRLRRQFPDQVRGRTLGRLRHQSRAERRCRGDRRSM